MTPSTTPGLPGYILPTHELRSLHKAAYSAQQRNHLEVCGAVIVRRGSEIALRLLPNRSDEPYRYALSLNDLSALEKELADSEFQVIGSFHSHPLSEAVPGPGDVERGFYKGMELIYDVCARQARLWYRDRTRSEPHLLELPLRVVSTQSSK